MKVHRLRLPGRSLCSIRSNRKWCKRRGSSLQCQNCFFVYPIIDCNLKNFSFSSHIYLCIFISDILIAFFAHNYLKYSFSLFIPETICFCRDTFALLYLCIFFSLISAYFYLRYIGVSYSTHTPMLFFHSYKSAFISLI